MCCLVLVAGLLGPRIAFLLTWIFTDRVAIAFQNGFLIPLLGLIVLPWTSLAYVFAYAPVVGVSFIGWLIVALGLFLDLATYAAQGRRGAYSCGAATT